MDLIKKGQQDTAVALMQKFVDENCSRIEKDYKQLNEQLPRQLEREGTRFLFVDYLKDWSLKTEVPLPFH